MLNTYDEMWTGDGIDWRCVEEERRCGERSGSLHDQLMLRSREHSCESDKGQCS